MPFFPVRLSLAALAGIVSALAQEQAPAPAPQAPAPSPGPPSTNPGGNQQPGQGNPRQQNPFPGQNRQDQVGIPERPQVMFLSGKVVMEDGTAPPELVLIERVCSGAPRPEGYTDTKGRFSFQLGQNAGMFADASTSGNDPVFGNSPGMGGGNPRSAGGFGNMGGQNRLMGCDLRASLPGFRSESIDLSQRRYMDNPDVGTIVLRRLAKVEGYTFSATSAFAPKDARKAYEKGRDLVKKQKWAEAEKEFQKAVDTYPKFAAAWSDLGNVLQAESKMDEARKAYEEAMKADAKFVTPYAQLMRMSVRDNKWADAAGYGSKAIKLNPYLSADIYFLSGVAHYQTKQMDVAEEYTRAALKLDEQHKNPKINHLLGVILVEKADYSGAAEAMRAYLKQAPEAKDANNVKQQLVEIEKSLVEKQNN